MSRFLGINKVKKLFTDPDLFLFDFFRKRLERKKVYCIGAGVSRAAGPAVAELDAQRLEFLGLHAFLIEVLDSRGGLRNGQDAESLLVQRGQICTAFQWIDAIRAIHASAMNIYTLDGAHRIVVHAEALGVSKRLAESLSNTSDFIIELSAGGVNGPVVLHFFVADTSPSGDVVLRSNGVWKKKFPHAELARSWVRSQKDTPRLPIDAVYTWVNCKDPDWLKEWQKNFPHQPFDGDRYSDNEELRYSLRSVAKYAPWLNKIFVVSNCAPPAWLSLEHPGVEWVWHEDLFPDHSVLPTFNSHAIESCLHRIRGLAEHFIYLNDDFFLAQPCIPDDFFDEYGRAVAYFEPAGSGYPDENSADTPDYIVATNNSAKLLQLHFKHRPRRLHKHVPYALQRSVLNELEARFADEFQQTRAAKLRGQEDIAVASFLCPHYGNATGRSVVREVKSFTAKPTNINKLLEGVSVRYKFICVNDGGNSASDFRYKEASRRLFLERYSHAAPWEIDG